MGIGSSIATAIATNLAFLWKHRGAVAAPPLDMRHPVRSGADLFRSKWWTIGWMMAVVGWLFHVGALAVAPLSLVQAVISGGFVVLAVLADRLFGFSLGRRQWAGIGIVAVGLAFLGATTANTAEEARYSVVTIGAFQAALLVVGLLLVLATRSAAVHRHAESAPQPGGEEVPGTGGPPQAPISAHATRHRRSRSAGLLLGTAAGLAFGVSDISIKALADAALGDLGVLVSPWGATAVVASIGAFYASARSLQIGEGISVISATTAAANLSTIAGGIVVFGESLGEGSLEIALRILAFALVIVGAALIPGPVRAAEAGAEAEREAVEDVPKRRRVRPRPEPRPQ